MEKDVGYTQQECTTKKEDGQVLPKLSLNQTISPLGTAQQQEQGKVSVKST